MLGQGNEDAANLQFPCISPASGFRPSHERITTLQNCESDNSAVSLPRTLYCGSFMCTLFPQYHSGAVERLDAVGNCPLHNTVA